MAHFNSSRQPLELWRAAHEAVTPEDIRGLRDSLVEQARAGKVGAAKLLLQYFGYTPPPEPDDDVAFLHYLRRLTEELGPEGQRALARNLHRLFPTSAGEMTGRSD